MMVTFLSWRRLQPIWGAIFTEIKIFMKIFCLHIRSMNLKATSGWLEGHLKLCAETYKPQEELLSSYIKSQAMTDWTFVESGETEHTELAEGVATIFPYRRYGRKRPGTGKNLCETRKWNTQLYRKIPNGKTGLPFQKFHFFRKFSSGTNRKIMFHLQSKRKTPSVTHFSKCDQFSPVWPIFRSVIHLSKCDPFFTVRHTFNSWTHFFLNVRYFSQCDPFFQMSPIFASVTHFPQCDPAFTVWPFLNSLIHFFRNVTHFPQCDPFFKCDPFSLVWPVFLNVAHFFPNVTHFFKINVYFLSRYL